MRHRLPAPGTDTLPTSTHGSLARTHMILRESLCHRGTTKPKQPRYEAPRNIAAFCLTDRVYPRQELARQVPREAAPCS